MVADITELENSDASEIHARRLNANFFSNAEDKKRIRIPFSRWIRHVGRKRSDRRPVFRTSTLVQEHPARGEEHNNILQHESDGSQPSDQQTNDTEVRDDVWCVLEIKLSVTSFNNGDVVGQTSTALDVLQNVTTVPPVVSVLLLLKRCLDGLNLVFQVGRFQFLCVFPRHFMYRNNLALM